MKLLLGFISLCITVVAVVWIVHSPVQNFPPKRENPGGTVTVFASHVEAFSPSVIRFSLRYQKRGLEKGSLVEANSKTNAALVEFVRTLGVSADSVIGKKFSIEKAWKWEDGKRVQLGFEISQNILVNLPDPSRMTDFISGIAQIPDLEISDSNSEIADAAEKRNGVYRKAVLKATEKAKAIAKASGKRLGEVLYVGDEQTTENAVEGVGLYDNAVTLGGARSARFMPEPKIDIGAGVTMKFRLK